MKLHPPVFERSDTELFGMISNSKKWSIEASEQAYCELQKRNYSELEIDKRKESLERIVSQSEAEELKQREANAKEGYTIHEMLLVIFGLPFRLLFNSGLLSSYWDLEKNNYKKKMKQRIVLILIAILFWLFVLRIALSLE